MASLSNALATFNKRVDESEQVVSSVEALWQTAPLRSDIRRHVGGAQMSALYEMAYLSLFGHWENFIEECLARMLVGQGSNAYTPALTSPPKAKTLAEARVRILNGQRFLLWYDPARSATRVGQHVVGSPLESVLLSAQTKIEHYAAVRHAIAHTSADAQASFKASSVALSGVAHRSPGTLLRSQDHSDPLNPLRWVRHISTDLRRFATSATT